MFKKMLRTAISLIGAVVGYGIFQLVKYMLVQSKVVTEAWFSPWKEIVLSLLFVIIFFILFFFFLCWHRHSREGAGESR